MKPMTTPHASPTRAQRLRWPLIVTGLLSCHVGAMVLAVNIASVGEGNAILPDYYGKALRWDEMRLQAAASESLGWAYTLTPSVLMGDDGLRSLRGTLADASGMGLADAKVHVRVWHYEAKRPQESGEVTTDANGAFRVSLPMELSGAWTCETMVSRGADVFIDEREIELFAAELPQALPGAGGPR